MGSHLDSTTCSRTIRAPLLTQVLYQLSGSSRVVPGCLSCSNRCTAGWVVKLGADRQMHLELLQLISFQCFQNMQVPDATRGQFTSAAGPSAAIRGYLGCMHLSTDLPAYQPTWHVCKYSRATGTCNLWDSWGGGVCFFPIQIAIARPTAL